MTIITEFLYKIKHLVLANQEEVGVCLIIIFVALSSFFLGKYSVINAVAEEDITFRDETTTTIEPKSVTKSGELISKTILTNQGDIRASGGFKEWHKILSPLVWICSKNFR